MIKNKLGIFVRAPLAGSVKTRLVPPLSPEQARDLYLSFLQDLIFRFHASRLRPTIFLAGEPGPELTAVLPPRWPVVAQRGESLGDRLEAAFASLLSEPGTRAAIIGSDSPDLPIGHVRRAFRLLKHRDAVLGPAFDGGYYLVGLSRPAPGLFRGIRWGGPHVLEDTVRAASAAQLTLSLTPPWYDVDDRASLHLLGALCRARRAARGERLPHTERMLAAIGEIPAAE